MSKTMAMVSPVRKSLPKKDEPKRLETPVKFMFDNGIIFELNRKFFHPIGYFVAVTDSEDESEDSFLEIYDCTEHPVSRFDPETYSIGFKKWSNFWENTARKIHDLRHQLLGFVVQRTPDIKQQTNHKQGLK